VKNKGFEKPLQVARTFSVVGLLRYSQSSSPV